ncbi:hypothetical protein [Herminiimonas contaminans]|uniref:Uncharacterized protein n=1 Tax=Herminiimonas contaminans TaxID=1111140 RepID=A0ABS0ESV7_9BURK|nr:hypothetical protein [Herminiimonas contaminans]MBF8177829.1 hypothetical protein [Herminiimonas contaminans]
MKTQVAQSSIDCFHGRVQNDRARQQALILSVMEPGRAYTGQQLAKLTGLTPNVISGRVFELREETKQLVRLLDRQVCPISHVSVFVHVKPVAMPVEQMELLQ